MAPNEAPPPQPTDAPASRPETSSLLPEFRAGATSVHLQDAFVLGTIGCHLAINGNRLVSGEENMKWLAKATDKAKVLLELCIQSHQEHALPELFTRTKRYPVNRTEVGHAIHAATNGRLELQELAQTVWRLSRPVFFDVSVLGIVREAFPELDPTLLTAASVAN